MDAWPSWIDARGQYTFLVFLTSLFFQRSLQVRPGPPQVPQRRTFGIANANCLQAGCPSCHPNSVKALKEWRINNLHHEPKKLSHFLRYLWFLLTDSNDFFTIQSKIIGAYTWNKIYHLTLSVLSDVSHYHVKCKQMQFCENSQFHSFSRNKRITKICYWLLLILISMHSLFLRDDINLTTF